MRRASLWLALIFIIVLSLPAAADQVTVVGQDVNFDTADGVKIYGTFYQAPGKGGPAVILLHMMRRNRADWDDFALDLASKGFSSLSIDLRGHGQSNRTKDGKAISLNSFSSRDFSKMTRDVEAAMNFLEKQTDKTGKVAIIGASIGANVALSYAAQNPDSVSAVVMLSPGLVYRNVETAGPMKEFTGPVFMCAGRGDKYSANAVENLKQYTPQRLVAEIYEGSAHGTNLFKTNKNLSKTLLDWLAKNGK